MKKVTLLFGGNGVGKTSLLKEIKDKKIVVEKDPEVVKIYSYFNSKHNARNMVENNDISISTKEDSMINLLFDKLASEKLSEGQSIIFSLQDVFKVCNDIPESEHAIWLLDEIDSGLSVENVDYLAKKIKQISEEKPNIQFVIAFNNYVFCKHFNEVFNMYIGEYIAIESFEQYFNLICKNKDILLEKRKNNMFTGEYLS